MIDTGRKDLFLGVNEPSDLQNLSDFEKRHVPVIEAPAVVRKGEPFAVTVNIGGFLKHPHKRDHFILFIELHADDTFLTRVDLTPLGCTPKVTFCIWLDQPVAELRAYQFCNMHGKWLGRKAIEVKA